MYCSVIINCSRNCKKSATISVVFILIISFMITFCIMTPKMSFAIENEATQNSQVLSQAMYKGLDEVVATNLLNDDKLELVDSRYVAKKLKTVMDQTGFFKNDCLDKIENKEKCNSISEDEILNVNPDMEMSEKRSTILDSLKEKKTLLESCENKSHEIYKAISDFSQMIDIFEKLTTGNNFEIKEIKTDQIKILEHYLGSEIATNVQEAINISKIDVPISKNVDISKLPYSPKTGVLQFSGLSWINLSMSECKVRIVWENPDGTTGDKTISSNWLGFSDNEHINLSEIGLEEDSEFKFLIKTKFGFDSNWSKGYSYSENSDFSVGFYTNQSFFTRGYIPIPAAYGNDEFINKTLDAMANGVLRSAVKIFVVGITAFVLGALTLEFSSGAHTVSGGFISALVNFGVGTLMVASDVVLTVVTSEQNVEDVDLNLQSKAKNWYQLENGDKYFGISGFQYVSAGYYWSKPMVHWRGQNEAGGDHKAYVNEVETRCYIEIACEEVMQDGVRMGKATGGNLADLSRSRITDGQSTLEDGDIIWFEAEVTLGKNRTANEKFVFSKKSNYQAGYFTEGTTLAENGYGTNPKAHLVSLGGAERVGYEMSRYVLTANGAYWSMVLSVAIGLTLVLATFAMDLYMASRNWNEIRKRNIEIETRNKQAENENVFLDSLKADVNAYEVELGYEIDVKPQKAAKLLKERERYFKAGNDYIDKITLDEQVTEGYVKGVQQQLKEADKRCKAKYEIAMKKREDALAALQKSVRPHNYTLEDAERTLEKWRLYPRRADSSLRDIATEYYSLEKDYLKSKISYWFLSGINSKLLSLPAYFYENPIQIREAFFGFSSNIRFFANQPRNSYILLSGFSEYIVGQIQMDKFYAQNLKGLEGLSSEDETIALMISQIGDNRRPVSDSKASLYQLFYDIQTYLNVETNKIKSKQLMVFSDKILYTLFKVVASNDISR